jgi:hypothetical protein
MTGYSTTSQDEITVTVTEHEGVELLTGMMGDLDPGVARRVLRKCNGDVHKAATAILEGDRGEPASWSPPKPPVHPDRAAGAGASSTAVQAQTSVIDLTTSDDDLSRALEASLQPQNGTKFGPSDRVPSADWAIVPSNVRPRPLFFDYI